MKKLFNIILGIAFLISFSSQVFAGKKKWNELFQSSMSADKRVFHRVAGLTFGVQDAGDYPALLMLGGMTYGHAYYDKEYKREFPGPYPYTFGSIVTSGKSLFLKDSANSVANTISYGDKGKENLKLTLSRLFPAIIIETENPSISLFSPSWKWEADEMLAVQHRFGGHLHNYSAGWSKTAGKKTPPGGTLKPLRWASPTGKGKILTGVLGQQAASTLKIPEYKYPEDLSKGKVATPNISDLAKNWLLLWYGKDSPFMNSKTPAVHIYQPYLMGKMAVDPYWPARQSVYQSDIPILLVFEKNPKKISYSKEKGIEFSYSGKAGKIAMIPLFGNKPLNTQETEKWLEKLPDEISKRCAKWSKLLKLIPVDVVEKSTYDSAKDTVTFSENFKFEKISKSVKNYSPIPPMLALAMQQKFPVSFSEKTYNADYPTLFGPMYLIKGNSYKWSVKGLKKYTGAKTLETVAGKKIPKELSKELSEEVDKILKAGHLAPGLFPCQGPNQQWANPAEVLYLLAELLPVLPKDQQKKLKKYLQDERKKYPPEQILFLDLTKGKRRESAIVDKWLKPYHSRNIRKSASDHEFYEPTPSLFRAYGLARYYQAVGEKPSADVLKWGAQALKTVCADPQWDTLGWFTGKYTVERKWMRFYYNEYTPWCLNRDIAGLIGLIRLYELAGKQTPEPAVAQLAKFAAFRLALAKYPQYLAQAGIIGLPENTEIRAKLAKWGDFSKPESFVFQVLEMNPYNVTFSNGAGIAGAMRGDPHLTFRDMVPELGQMFADWGMKENVKKYLQRINLRHPNWFAAKADAMDGNEHAFMYPQDSHQLFMAHTWITDTEPKDLQQMIDVSWMKFGDLYYLHKLAETIKASK